MCRDICLDRTVLSQRIESHRDLVSVEVSSFTCSSRSGPLYSDTPETEVRTKPNRTSLSFGSERTGSLTRGRDLRSTLVFPDKSEGGLVVEDVRTGL